jgi:hypothetical protein
LSQKQLASPSPIPTPPDALRVSHLPFASQKRRPKTENLSSHELSRLGAEQYRKLLGAVGISVAEEYEDEGENHYFDAFKGKIE